ncbi:hypothetical protein CCYA_CCYA02G0653 [Cyanidiococcus yangmingshanensis]|nr:hypothetical protein CCYA_CCYA02G0653 [Cyanidiococcus yangmingshanensis]
MFVLGAGNWRKGRVVNLARTRTTKLCTLSEQRSEGTELGLSSRSRVHRTLPPRPARGRQTGLLALKAKKGKPNVPLAPQNDLQVPEDGTPVFAILARSPVSGLWYPLGSMKGDGRAKMLVTAMRTSWGRKFYGDTLNKGVARSVFGEQGRRMIHAALRKYSALRKYTADDLEYGYRVIAKDFDYPTQMIRPEQAMSLVQWLRMKLSGGKPPSIALTDEIAEKRK